MSSKALVNTSRPNNASSQSIEEMRQGEKIGGDWHSRNCLEKLCSLSFFHVSRGCLKLTTVAVTSFENDHLLSTFLQKGCCSCCYWPVHYLLLATKVLHFFCALHIHCILVSHSSLIKHMLKSVLEKKYGIHVLAVYRGCDSPCETYLRLSTRRTFEFICLFYLIKEFTFFRRKFFY